MTQHDSRGGSDVVSKLVEFQRTGRGFDGFWNEIHPIVVDFARRNLVKIGVRVRPADPEGAVGDVVSETCLALRKLSLPGVGGQFRPEKMKKPGLSGVRAWLWRVVRSKAVNWQRDTIGGRGVTIKPEAGLDWNDLPPDGEGTSIVKQVVAKIERPDLLPILAACINELPDPKIRRIVRMRLDEDLSQRGIAKRLRLSPVTIHRRLQAAYALLRPLLEERGVDMSWVAA
jgi:RNA polymerase sigma factor (sigma-70 family)